MPIDAEFKALIDRVSSSVDIVDIIGSYIPVIKKGGKQYVAKCPFHDDNDPSLQISQEKQIFHCFVCHTGGNAIRFVELYEHIPFMEALKKVARIGNVTDPRLEDKKSSYVKKEDDSLKPLKRCLEDLTDYYEYALQTQEGATALSYLEGRGLNEDIRHTFRIGYAPKDGAKTCKFLESRGHSLKTLEDTGISPKISGEHYDSNSGRVVFPILDIDSNVIGYSARRLNNDENIAKYKNSSEGPLFNKSTILYNLNNAIKESKPKKYIYIMEGFMDVLALYRVNEKSAVAIMGTAFTKEHIEILRKLNCELRFCLDNDHAGQENMMKILDKMADSGLNYRFTVLKGNGKDADEILTHDGEEVLKQGLNNLLSPFDFAMHYYSTSSLSTQKEKKDVVFKFLPYLAKIKSRLELDEYIRKISTLTGYSQDIIMEYVSKSRNKSKEEIETMSFKFRPERIVLKKLILAERKMLYLMLSDARAIEFYEKNMVTFTDDIYSKIASYVSEYIIHHECVDINNLISFVEANRCDTSIDESDPTYHSMNAETKAIIDEIIEISNTEDRDRYSEILLQELLNTIKNERVQMYEKEVLDKMLVGKSDIEKARILADYNKKRVQKIREENEDEKK